MQVNREWTTWTAGVNFSGPAGAPFPGTSPAQSFQDFLKASAPAESSSVMVEVKRGQHLTGIVRDQLRALGIQPTGLQLTQAIADVAKANGVANPNLILPGQKLDLSVLNALAPASVPMMTSVQERTAAAVPEPAQPVAMLQNAQAAFAVPLPPEVSASLSPISKVLKQDVVPAVAPPIAPPVVAPEPALAVAAAVAITPPTEPATVEETIEAVTSRVDLSQLVREILGEETPTLASVPEVRAPWASVLEGRARITSDFGIRSDPFSGNTEMHSGIDLAAKAGTAIHPYESGVVTYSGWQDGYGRVVVVRHDDGTESVYGHNSQNKVIKGQKVTENTVLAEVGSTGRSTGPHLHFEIRKNGKAINPVPYIAPEPTRYAQR